MTDHTDTSGNGPAGEEAPIALRLDADLAMRLAAFISRNPEFTGRRERAAKHVLRLWLAEHGYDGTHADAGTPPDRLNASNDD